MYDHLYNPDQWGISKQTMRWVKITLTLRSASDLLLLKNSIPHFCDKSIADMRSEIEIGSPYVLGEFLRTQGQSLAVRLEDVGIAITAQEHETIHVTPTQLEDGVSIEIEDANENERVIQEMIRHGCEFVEDFITE